MARWPVRKFRRAKEWVDRQWHEPRFAHPAVGLIVHYLMGLRCDVAAATGNAVSLEDAKLKFRTGGAEPEVTDPWDEYDRERGIEPVKQDVALPSSPRINAGGRVRITQPDGTLRLYDPTLGKYVE